MKKLWILLLLAAALPLFAKNFKNTTNRDGSRVSYSFQMNQKCAPLAGVFTSLVYNKYFTYKTFGNSMSSRGGGGGKVVKVPVERTVKGKHDVIIVGQRLAKMADGDKIQLKSGQTLFKIGVFTLPDGRTLSVYSFNPKDTVERYLPPHK